MRTVECDFLFGALNTRLIRQHPSAHFPFHLAIACPNRTLTVVFAVRRACISFPKLKEDYSHFRDLVSRIIKVSSCQIYHAVILLGRRNTVGSSLTTSGRSLLDPITALPFLALSTPLYPTSADLWLVVHSHVHAILILRLCYATALNMPLRHYFPTCAASFTVLEAIARTDEYKTAD